MKNITSMHFQAKNSFQRKSNNLIDRNKYILAILFFCGFNFKIFKFFNHYKFWSTLYCAFLITITTYATIYCWDNTNYLQIWSSSEYILSVFILVAYNSKLSTFSFKLYEIDIYLRFNLKQYYKNKQKAAIMIIVLWIVRISFTTIHCLCYNCYTSISVFTICLFSSFALDLNRVWRFMVLDIVYHRLQLLRKRLEESAGCTYYLYVNKNKTLKEDNIKFCNHIYKNIADITDLITPELHASMFASIVCSIPKLVVNIYHILLVVKGQEPVESIGFLIMHIFHVCFLLFSPCILIELQSLEVERIRHLLINRLIEEKDPRNKENIHDFIMYTNIRNFENKIWRFIPLNVSLPIEIANMCISTIIVVINYTNLYGN